MKRVCGLFLVFFIFLACFGHFYAYAQDAETKNEPQSGISEVVLVSAAPESASELNMAPDAVLAPDESLLLLESVDENVPEGAVQPLLDMMAAPVGSVAPQPVLNLSDHVTVVELFTSQNCVFCYEADQYFNKLVKRPAMLAVACHVDYFDRAVENLSKPFCTARQSAYVPLLGDGPAYTPQIVVNGTVGVVGYKEDKIEQVLRRQAENPVPRLRVTHVPEMSGMPDQNAAATLVLDWPEAVEKEAQSKLVIWLGLYDKPRRVDMKVGPHAGEEVVYRRIISEIQELGTWPAGFAGKDKASIKAPFKTGHQGALILLQNPETGRIRAAGEFIL